MSNINNLALLTILLFLPTLGTAIDDNMYDQKDLANIFFKQPNHIINKNVKESYTFYGLASYYNSIEYFLLSDIELTKADEENLIALDEEQWLAVVGRFSVLLVKASGLKFKIHDSELEIFNPDITSSPNIEVKLLAKNYLLSVSPEFDQIRYSHLWAPLAFLAKQVERSLNFIQSSITSSWGWTLVIFAILIKILLLPVGIVTVKFQRDVSKIQAKLAPIQAEIKKKYDGEEAHNRLMAAYKENGVSPFFALKPVLGSFIQIPVLIVIFNALGEMQQFSEQSFLWISNLAYPDTIVSLGRAIPMFGNTINLLPFAMTAIAIIATILFQNRHAPKSELSREKRNLYLMTGAFFILFYPFPAVMVLYWTLTNALQIIQQQLVKI